MHRYTSPGNALRALTLEEGWTLEELAGKLAFSPYLTQKLLNDQVPVTAVVADQLARVTGEPIDKWLGLYTKLEQSRTPIGSRLNL